MAGFEDYPDKDALIARLCAVLCISTPEELELVCLGCW
eukprot:gene4414-4668_t